jgi:hypothetical protein
MIIPVFEVRSISYSAGDCLFEWGLCVFFSVLTISSLVGIFPVAGASFFIVPAILVAGLAAVKISTTPEVVKVFDEEVSYCQGRSKCFRFKSCNIRKVSFERNFETFHNKLMVFHFVDDTEYSVPYKYFSDSQLDEVVRYFQCD